jgi:hypothetical protein
LNGPFDLVYQFVVMQVKKAQKSTTVFPVLSFDDGGSPVLDPVGCAAVAAAAKRVAIVGVARGGKSTYFNLICSRAAGIDFNSFAAAAGTSHVTIGISAAVVNGTAFLDCQGIRLGDGSKDKALLLCCHYFADVLVYNQAAVLDNTIFSNLTQMAAFVALTESGKSDPPVFVARLRDFTAGRLDEKDEIARFLSPEFDDENRTMRSAFAKLFSGIHVVATDLVGRSQLLKAANAQSAFLEENADWAASIDRILSLAREAPPKTVSATTLANMFLEEVGLKTHDLDALKVGMELTMRRVVDDASRLGAPLDGTLASFVARCKEVVEAVEGFDTQFARVNDISYREQRDALLAVFTPVLEAASKAFVMKALTGMGFEALEGEVFRLVRRATWEPKSQFDPAGTVFASYEAELPSQVGGRGELAYVAGEYRLISDPLSAGLKALRFLEDEKFAATLLRLGEEALQASEKITDVRRRASTELLHKTVADAKRTPRKVVEDFIGNILGCFTPSIQLKMADAVRELYPVRVTDTYAVILTVRRDPNNNGLRHQFAVDAAVDDVLVAHDRQRVEPPFELTSLKIDQKELVEMIQRDRRIALGGKLLLCQVRRAERDPPTKNASDYQKEVADHLRLHFGRLPYVVYVSYYGSGTTRNFLASFEGAPVLRQFWEIAAPFGDKGSNMACLVQNDKSFDSRANDDAAHIAFKPERARAALRKLDEKFSDKVVVMNIE